MTTVPDPQRFIGLLALWACLVAGPASSQVEPPASWRVAVVTVLDVEFGGTGFHARWTYQRCDCGDLLVRAEQTAPDGVSTGELLLVDGQALLARGFGQQGEDLEPLFQAPSLMLQLAYSLLDMVEPGGPAAVTRGKTWERTEPNRDFRIDTGLADGIFAAPWAVSGRGWATAQGHRRFELRFDFTSPDPAARGTPMWISLSGDLGFAPQPFPYDGTAGLDGWTIQWLSLNETASSDVRAGLTLEELRAEAGRR